MSSVKSPQDKKDISLNRDHRNVYGENAKASRKLIPLRKQQSHQAERRTANQPLLTLKTYVSEERATTAELESRDRHH